MIPDRHLDRLEQDAAAGKRLSPAHTILLIDALREAQAKASTPAHLLIEAGEMMNASIFQMLEETKTNLEASNARHEALLAVEQENQSRLAELDVAIAEVRAMAEELERERTPQ